jgi:hypothetical protein
MAQVCEIRHEREPVRLERREGQIETDLERNITEAGGFGERHGSTF